MASSLPSPCLDGTSGSLSLHSSFPRPATVLGRASHITLSWLLLPAFTCMAGCVIFSAHLKDICLSLFLSGHFRLLSAISVLLSLPDWKLTLVSLFIQISKHLRRVLLRIYHLHLNRLIPKSQEMYFQSPQRISFLTCFEEDRGPCRSKNRIATNQCATEREFAG